MSKRQKVSFIADLFAATALKKSSKTVTKAGWCLREGLEHVCRVQDDDNEGRQLILPLVQRHGLPGFYSCLSQNNPSCRHEATDEYKEPKDCFQSLCRIIVGQFVSGKAARVAWHKLLAVTDQNLTPERILEIVKESDIETSLQKPAGTTRTKANSLVDLAGHFSSGKLSDDFLTTASEDEVRSSLLAVKGIGPWSVDMFVIFYLERSNVMPLGDLAVRKGLQKVFGIKGHANKGDLCPKKDRKAVQERLQPYAPYQSLVTYYMYRAMDTPNVNDNQEETKTSSPAISKKVTPKTVEAQESPKRRPSATEVSTPPNKKTRKSPRALHRVTP